jgi:hypothetical protein
MRRFALALPVAFAISCTGIVPGDDAGTPEEVEFGERFGVKTCDSATIAKYPGKRCQTFRGLAGVSMGGGTAARLGFSYPDMFDVVGVMGTPFSDNEFFWGMIESNHMGGFCPLEDLENIRDTLGPDALNDPTTPGVFCGVHDVFPLAGTDQVSPGLFPAVEGSRCSMFRSDFNHWYRGPKAGRGGSFTRNSLIEIFHDLVAAYGNPLYYNDVDPYFPPGVPTSWYVAPGSNPDISSLCANPIRLEGVYNREYNPEGAYPVITFCDGGPSEPSNCEAIGTCVAGNYVPTAPGAHSNVIEFALAVDLNDNGIRDYGEPILINSRERFLDVGVDNVADVDEDGYDPVTNPDPAGDNWDPLTNPTGTEKNLRWDDGEPYDDDGLDGVPGTVDYGEGNGNYDVNPRLQRSFDRSPSRLFAAMDDEQAQRLDVWMDSGIRDFINSTQITNALYASIKARVDDAHIYKGFKNLPGIDPNSGYIYFDADYSRDAMGQVAYLQYGDAEKCPISDDILGDGNHVGPDIVDRIYTLFSFLSERMPKQGRDRSIGGQVEDLESANGALTDFGFMASFESEALGRTVDYGVSLPPDYFLSDAIAADRRYPVLYFFHGQGQDARGMVAVGYLLFGAMKESARQDRIDGGKTDFQRAIIVWVDGECNGDECHTGNFYADFEGRARQDRQYEKAFLELVKVVEDRYRVKEPELVDPY